MHHASEAAVKASYIVSHQLAVASKPFSDGELIKKCMLLSADLICPDKRQGFANISLSRNTVAERITDLARDLNNQLVKKVASFVAFSVAIDESTDITDVAQLAVFIRGIDKDMKITEEFVELVAMTDITTADDIFDSLVRSLDKFGVDWTRAVSLSTDGAPQMIGRKIGVATKLKEKVMCLNVKQEFCNFHCILHQETLCSKTMKMSNVMDVVIKTVNFIRVKGLNHRQFSCLLEDVGSSHGLPYHTEVRWLSRGTVLKHFYTLRTEIQLFLDMKGRPMSELQDSGWLRDLAFLVDIMEHLNGLNRQNQGRNKLVTDLYESICAFESKLELWEKQLGENNPVHFPTLKSYLMDTQLVTDIQTEQYRNKISALRSEFRGRFADFKRFEKAFAIVRNPFSAHAHEAPQELQMELLDLLCDSLLKDKFCCVDTNILQLCGFKVSKDEGIFFKNSLHVRNNLRV